MFDLKKCSNFGLVVVRIVMISTTFCIFSTWIFFLTEGKLLPKEHDWYFICFALSVFLGSASYSLCHSIAKMSEPLFRNLVNFVRNYLVIAVIYTTVVWMVAVLTSYDKNSFYYAFGISLYLFLLGSLYFVLRKFDSDLDEIIISRKDEDIKKLTDALATYMDDRYVMSGDSNKGKSETSQK